MMRKCCRHEGGPCFNDIDLAAYVVEYTTGIEDAYCLNNENWCFIDSCFIDVFFVTEICALACCDGSCTVRSKLLVRQPQFGHFWRFSE